MLANAESVREVKLIGHAMLCVCVCDVDDDDEKRRNGAEAQHKHKNKEETQQQQKKQKPYGSAFAKLHLNAQMRDIHLSSCSIEWV